MLRFLSLIAISFYLTLVPVDAQTFRGAISGAITDASGAAVPNAKVTATNDATGVQLNTAGTGSGAFAFQDLPPGAYTVNVSAVGMQSVSVTKVEVTAGSVRSLPVSLAVGAAATAVEVSAAAVALDAQSSTQTSTLPDKSVQEVPLNGRDFTQLIAVTPGFAGYSLGGFGSLNGTRPNQVNWQIDGTDNNDFWHNIPAINQGGVSGIAGVIMPLDAIDEFSVQTQSNAETGRSAGGTVNLTIKSGTNQLHGTAYYYNRNEFFAASSPFFVASPQFPKAPELRNYNAGVTAGGPVIKDKTFLFAGFEHQNYLFGLTGLSTEPSAAWVSRAAALLANSGGTYGAYAPVTQSALSARLLSTLWPGSITNLPAAQNNYFATVPGTGYSYNGVVRLDHNFTPSEHLSVHAFAGQGKQTQPPGASLALATASSNLGYYFEVAPLHVQNYSAVLNSVLTGRLTNQLLLGTSYFQQAFHDANNSFNMSALGLNLSPGALIGGQPIAGASNIVIRGFDQVGITPPEGRTDATGHLTDILSWVAGKQQFRFGGEYRLGRVDEYYFRRSTGQFNFDGTQGPWAAACAATPANAGCDRNTLALADFLAGDVSSSSIAVGNAERYVAVTGFNFFGQDDWQITPKLNLNAGLRWEYFGPLHSVNHPDIGVFVAGQGLQLQGSGIPNIFRPDYHNFAPRFGFAYQPRNSWVVRGGFGMFFDQININPFLDFRPPIAAANGLEDNPIGPAAVDNYSRNAYNWTTAQSGGASLFPGVTTCLGNYTTEKNCLSSSQIFNVFSVNQNFRTPYFFNYNFNVEKSLGSSAVLQLGYVGSQGRKLGVMQNINQNGAYSAQYPNYGSVIQLNSIGTSNYNSLQSTLRIRRWHGISAQFAYTWSHTLDEVTEYRGVLPLDSFNLKQEYGSSDFDIRHNFTAFFNWDVPGSSHLRALTHGWTVSGLVTLRSGEPFNFDAGTQRPGMNLIADPFAGVNHTFSAALGGEPWVNPAAFCVPGTPGCAGTANPAGNLSRNAFSGPGFANTDLSVFRVFPVKELLKIQLRAEMFNIFNRINLASGAYSVGSNGVVSDTIGDYSGAPGLGPGEPFNMQLALKIIF